jgi:hypothetical protein
MASALDRIEQGEGLDPHFSRDGVAIQIEQIEVVRAVGRGHDVDGPVVALGGHHLVRCATDVHYDDVEPPVPDEAGRPF